MSVEVTGGAGVEYLLEGSNDRFAEWNAVAALRLENGRGHWEEGLGSAGARFFRARTVTEGEERFARNFRLIDQHGVARELAYSAHEEHLKAIVLIFTDGDYFPFATKIELLRTHPEFEQSVLFWTIDLRAEVTRAQLVDEALFSGMEGPILHEPWQLVARDYEARFNGECQVIRLEDLKVVYRGLIDDGEGAVAGRRAYLAEALRKVLGSKEVTTTRVEPTRGRVNRAQRPVADYATEIAPLLQNKCVTCHSPGNIAPFALTSYESVREYGSAMKGKIMAGEMPPWHADPEYGKFKNDFSLAPAEKARLVDWFDAGMPRVGTDDPLTNVPPPPSKWPEELGPPDQIVTIPMQQIPATGTIAYRYIYARATNNQAEWLRAAIVKPSNRRVVHHYNVWEGETATPLVVAAYSPGRTERPYPEGTAWLLHPRMEMTFNLHYTATGQEEFDQPELALWYTNAPPARRLKGTSAQNSSFVIPPHVSDHEVKATHRFLSPARIYFVNPHMHVRGSRMRFELTVPGQPKRTIASIPKYDFHWQTVYHFDPPLDVPANSVIDVTGAFDNSHLNHQNPDPTATVKWGDQSWDEMFIGYIEYSDL